MRATLTSLLLVLSLALAACSGAPKKADLTPRQLELKVSPASPVDLAPGTIVQVMARPVPAVEMEWVSGTVKIFRAPVRAFKQDAKDGSWKFKMQVPPMVTVPKGTYQIKAWGRTRTGQDIEGSQKYVVQ